MADKDREITHTEQTIERAVCGEDLAQTRRHLRHSERSANTAINAWMKLAMNAAEYISEKGYDPKTFERLYTSLKSVHQGQKHRDNLRHFDDLIAKGMSPPYNPEPTDLVSAVESAINICGAMLKKGNRLEPDLHVEYNGRRPKEFYFNGCHFRMTQVMIDILVNMKTELRYTDDPYIKIDIHELHSDSVGEDRDCALVVIENNGPEIPDTERIFDEGYSTHGTDRGSGLALCRRIINKFNGEIYADSGDVVTFYVRLPLCTEEEIENKPIL